MKKKGSRLRTTLLICLLLVGIILIFYNQIQNFIIAYTGDQLSIDRYSTEEIDYNLKVETTFDFDEVQTLSILDVLKAQANAKNLPVIGSIAIPNVDLQLPILKGISKYSLAVGAGTMKPNQEMGEGNYALASHYYEKKDVLFGPLYRAKKGDEIYITDLQNIYEYVITNVQIIEATDVYIIDDIPGQTLLTLITCAEKGTKRLSVQAKYVNTYPFDTAPKDLTNAF